MAVGTASSPATPSPPSKPVTSSLPPLITTTNIPRRTISQRSQARRQSSYASRRTSAFSPGSKLSNPLDSRPPSHVFPAFHSSLSYTLVRDFAYLADHPMHYGPLPHESGLTTPASERRFSDPAFSSWDTSDVSWSAGPSWTLESAPTSSTREQLPAMSFTDGDGPPYSEDEDLRSPVVTASRHRKHKSGSTLERGRSPGDVPLNGGSRYYNQDSTGDADGNGPGGTYEDLPPTSLHFPHPARHRDSNFAKPLQRQVAPVAHEEMPASEEEASEVEEDNEDSRYSRDYSFTIASPDEEMHGKAVALFDFVSEHQNELSLKEGQIILVSYRHGQGWLVAEDPKTGESGLVPEEFVRLVRDIEGGLNGLVAVDIHEGEADTTEILANDPESAITPTPASQEFANQAAVRHNANNGMEKHPPVQSTFSTSSKDLDPYPLPSRTEDVSGSPDRPQQFLERIPT